MAAEYLIFTGIEDVKKVDIDHSPKNVQELIGQLAFTSIACKELVTDMTAEQDLTIHNIENQPLLNGFNLLEQIMEEVGLTIEEVNELLEPRKLSIDFKLD